MANALKILDYEENNLLRELTEIIETSQRQVAMNVNSGVVLMFWNIGNRVNEFVLNNQRAEYGKQIVVTLSRQLQTKYGNNFEEKNFRRTKKTNVMKTNRVLATIDTHIPYAPNYENDVLPSTQKVYDKLPKLMKY